MKKFITLLSIAALTACSSLSTADQSALLASSSTLVSQAAHAFAGTNQDYQLAANGFDGLAAVMQAYLGQPIPASVLIKSPGVTAVAKIASQYISTKAKVNQADVDAIWAAAANIAAGKLSSK